MYPTREEVKKLAASGKYKRVPVCREIYADEHTPVQVMRILRGASRHCCLLESASQDENWGRYSFLGFDPAMEITCTEGLLRIRSTDSEGTLGEKEMRISHPKEEIRRILNSCKSPRMDNMPPFTGGLVGYFSYDYIRYSEPKLKLDSHGESDFKDVDLMLFDQVIAFDHYRQKICLIAGVQTDDVERSYQQAEDRIDRMLSILQKGKPMEFQKIKLAEPIYPQFDKKRYCEMVEKARHYIREGDIFQVMLSNPRRAGRREACLIRTGYSESQIRCRICFILTATISRSPVPLRKHW